MLKQPAINTGDAIPVKKCVSEVPDHMKGKLNEMLDEMLEVVDYEGRVSVVLTHHGCSEKRQVIATMHRLSGIK